MIKTRKMFRISSFLYYGIILLLTIICQSCINNISDNNLEQSDIPVNLFTALATSQVPYDGFTTDDAIGVYMIVAPSTLEKTRYVDNMKFTYSSTNDFIPQEDVYFPEGKNTCDIISYFPYQKSAIGKGNTSIDIEVQANQTSKENMTRSDFMIATSKGIIASENPVELNFEHKLSCLNIQLKATSGYTLEMLLAANPVVKIKNVYTKAAYDFTNDTFTTQYTKADIIPYGVWEIKDDALCGKSAIVIPQTLPDSHTIIELHIGNRIFQCAREEKDPLISGTCEEYTITLQSSENALKAHLSVSINDWTHVQTEAEAKELPDFIDISTLSFNKLYVYKAVHKDEQVAEIALEYLCTDGIETQAIVIYPFKEGKADLSNGTVAQIKGEVQSVHGGKVSWDITDNALSYTPGTSVPISLLYISTDGEIKTNRQGETLQVQLIPDMLTDIRGTETIEYPIVKIGTQYWTRTMCKSKKYTDGTDIEAGGTNVKPTAQYYNYENVYIFYNMPAVSNKQLVPNGWRICNEIDVNRLNTYIKENAAVLKSENKESWDGSSYPFTNLTGFTSAATGYYNKTFIKFKETSAYWCVDNTSPEPANKMFTLDKNSNTIKILPATTDMALAIKYIRE